MTTHPVAPTDGDVVIRDAATKVIQNINDKVHQRTFQALHDGHEDEHQRIAALQDALSYAAGALQAITTAVQLGRGGYIGWDDETSLYFRGILEGAVIDRDNEFSVHT